MTDVIINLVILFIVVFTVLKRLQEVARKGVEIKEPSPEPGAPPIELPMVREFVPEPPEEQPEPAPSVLPPVAEVPHRQSLKELFERLERQYHEITEPPEPYTPLSEDAFESGRERRNALRSDYSKPATTGKTALPTEPVAHPFLSFSSSSVVNGIIMSEILGPPTGLRESPYAHAGWWASV